MRVFSVLLLFVAFAAVSALTEVKINWDYFATEGNRLEINQKVLTKINKEHEAVIQKHVDAINGHLNKPLSPANAARFITSIEEYDIDKNYAVIAEETETFEELQETYKSLGKMHALVFELIGHIKNHLTSDHYYSKDKTGEQHMHHAHHTEIKHGVKELHKVLASWVQTTTYAEGLQQLFDLLQKLGQKIHPVVLVLINLVEECLENGAENHDGLQQVKIALAQYEHNKKHYYTHSNDAKESVFFTGGPMPKFLLDALTSLLG